MFMQRERYPVKRKHANVFILLLYLVLGAYFVNFSIGFISIPESVLEFNNWIIFAGGVLMLFGAINYFKAKRR